MESSIPDRYEKNPMLVVLENYVLDSLGLLEPAKAAKLNDMICRTFGGGGGKDWKQIVRQQFALPPDTDTTLRQLWKSRQEESDAKQQDLAAEDFARSVVDEMFTGLGD